MTLFTPYVVGVATGGHGADRRNWGAATTASKEFSKMSLESGGRTASRSVHDHYTLLYESREERFETVARYVEAGLRADEKCLYLRSGNTESEIVRALRRRGVDVGSALEAGDLSIRPVEEVYFADGRFDPTEGVEFLERAVSEALAAGYSRLRVTGETDWIADREPDPESFEEYERRIDALFPNDALVGLCQYDRSRLPPEILDAALRTHPQVACEAESRPNPYYVPREDSDPETVAGKVRTVAELSSPAECDPERRLAVLGDFGRQLREAGRNEIERRTVELVSEGTDAAFAALWSYDETTGGLRPRVVRSGPQVESAAIIEAVDERVWDAFAARERRRFSTGPVDGRLLPVGQYGVVSVGTVDGGVGNGDVAFLEAVCGHAEAALEAERCATELEAERAELEAKVERLERSRGIGTVARELAGELVDASTRAEVAETTCERLLELPSVSFAWFGAYEARTNVLRPRGASGDERNYVAALSPEEGLPAEEPSGRAVRTREVRVVDDVSRDQSLERWQRQALRRGYRSVISLPVQFDGALYGVLSLYADAPNAFDGTHRTVLEEIADVVAYAANRLERKRALVPGDAIELELCVSGDGLAVTEFADRTGCRIEIDAVLSNGDRGFRIPATVKGVPADELRAFATASPTIDEVAFLSEGDEAHTCEFVVTDRGLVAELLDHNAVPESASVRDGEIRLVVRLPRGKDVREFVSALEAKYSDVELLSRRDRERSPRSLTDLETELEDELSDRQLEVLKVAFRSGYFEQPRERTTKEIADALDVTHPTVSRHLREGQRRILAALLDDE